jgi:hypothetical protein
VAQKSWKTLFLPAKCASHKNSALSLKYIYTRKSALPLLKSVLCRAHAARAAPETKIDCCAVRCKKFAGRVFRSTEKFSTRGDAINIFASAPPNLQRTVLWYKHHIMHVCADAALVRCICTHEEIANSAHAERWRQPSYQKRRRRIINLSSSSLQAISQLAA